VQPGAGCTLQKVKKEELVKLLLETSTLARAVAQVIQARSADYVVPVYDYFVDTRGAQQEGPFHTHAIAGYPADGEGRIVAVYMYKQHSTSKFLNTFPGAFLDFYVHADCITRMQYGNVGIYRSFDGFQKIGHSY
jgi:hypothetical protein